MTSQQQPTNNRWQWDDSQWSDTPAAPTSLGQVPEPDDGDEFSAAVRRLLRWARLHAPWVL